MAANTTQMSREQKVAFSILHQHWQNFDGLTQLGSNMKRTAPLLHTNFVASSYYPIEKTNIPCEPYWCWNQSNAKVVVQVDAFTTVTFRKVSTKKKSSSCLPAPSYKIWLFEIDSSAAPSQYFLWCEKGTLNVETSPRAGVKTEIGTIFPEALSIQSFAFLRPFVEEQVADEFGWYHC